MSEQPQQIPAKRRRWPRRILVVILVLAALYAAYRYTLHRMVEAKVDEIRKQGYPVTLAELDKWYPQPPPGENAADALTNAFALYVIDWKTLNKQPLGIPSKPLPGDQPLSDEVRQTLRNYVTDHQRVLGLLHQAVVKPRCRYPIVSIEGYSTSVLPSVQKANHSVRLLLLEALHAVDKNDLDQVVDSLVSSATLARTISEAPFEETLFYRDLSVRQITMALSYTLTQLTMNENQLERLREAMNQSVESSESALAKVFVGERCQKMTYLDTLLPRVRDWNGMVSRASIFYLFYKAGGLVELDKLSYLNLTDDYLRAAQSPFPSRLRLYQAAMGHAHLMPRYDILLRFLSYHDWDVLRDAKCMARLRCAVTGLAVEKYRLANARLPDELPNPALLDPFDGQPLRYKKLAKGYVVYSVGEDGKDDGGDEKKDITFTVER
jgi:hypothetical protein